MTREHPNATAYRQTADAFRSGDTTTLAALIDVDVLWHVPGSSPMAGEIEGSDRLLAWIERARTKGLWLTESDVFGSDDHVCAISMMGARRNGVDVQTRVISLFRYRDGRQLERWFYPDDMTAWDQIYAD